MTQSKDEMLKQQSATASVAPKKRTLPPGMTPWKPGQSGNPKGGPKIPQQVRDAIQAATPKAVEVLVDLLVNSDNEKIRVTCAQTLLDRAYGRAAQAVDVRVTDVAQTHLQIMQELQRRRQEDMRVIEVKPIEPKG